MGVYIKGMEMPTSCWDCYFQDCGNCVLNAHKVVDKCIIEDNRDDDCPLFPVPEHGRLIDKDALEQDISGSVVFSGRERNAELIGANKIINRLHHASTIIPAPCWAAHGIILCPRQRREMDERILCGY